MAKRSKVPLNRGGRWDDLLRPLRDAIIWDSGYWYELAPGYVLHGCGCLNRYGDAYLCDYYQKTSAGEPRGLQPRGRKRSYG